MFCTEVKAMLYNVNNIYNSKKKKKYFPNKKKKKDFFNIFNKLKTNLASK